MCCYTGKIGRFSFGNVKSLSGSKVTLTTTSYHGGVTIGIVELLEDNSKSVLNGAEMATRAIASWRGGIPRFVVFLQLKIC